MKVLLDENLPRRLASYLTGHECRTVSGCGWAGKKNGELLILADPAFDVLLTLDKNVPYQQNLASRRIGILIIRGGPVACRIWCPSSLLAYPPSLRSNREK